MLLGRRGSTEGGGSSGEPWAAAKWGDRPRGSSPLPWGELPAPHPAGAPALVCSKQRAATSARASPDKPLAPNYLSSWDLILVFITAASRCQHCL